MGKKWDWSQFRWFEPEINRNRHPKRFLKAYQYLLFNLLFQTYFLTILPQVKSKILKVRQKCKSALLFQQLPMHWTSNHQFSSLSSLFQLSPPPLLVRLALHNWPLCLRLLEVCNWMKVVVNNPSHFFMSAFGCSQYFIAGHAGMLCIGIEIIFCLL